MDASAGVDAAPGVGASASPTPTDPLLHELLSCAGHGGGPTPAAGAAAACCASLPDAAAALRKRFALEELSCRARHAGANVADLVWELGKWQAQLTSESKALYQMVGNGVAMPLAAAIGRCVSTAAASAPASSGRCTGTASRAAPLGQELMDPLFRMAHHEAIERGLVCAWDALPESQKPKIAEGPKWLTDVGEEGGEGSDLDWGASEQL
jgi:hypothetical protein